MDTEFRRADETRDYGDDMREYLDDLTVLYESVLAKWARGMSDEDLLNACLAKMISITVKLLPKLDGGGEKTRDLRNKFREYDSWIDSIQIPKTEDSEADKIPRLYLLIHEAYEKLGYTSTR